MEFKLLGPLEVRRGDSSLAFDRPRERALLLFLLLHANEPVPVDLLLESLWPGATPASAKRSLQVHVSRVRAALGREGTRLSSSSRGYELLLEPGERDDERFEAMIDAGRRALRLGDPIEAEVLLRDALALWRGPPLVDVAYESFAQPAIERLEELRTIALAMRIGADLRLGRHEQVIPELRLLVARHAAHETFRELLMLALYRSGRQHEALEAYRAAHEQLVRERGLEPSPRLRDLERAILNHDPALTDDLRSGWRPAHDGAKSPARSESGDRARAARLAARASALAETAGPHLRGAEQVAWMRALDAEEGSIWAGCRAALRTNAHEVVLKVGAALWPHWESRGWLDEARDVLDAALATAAPAAPGRRGGLIAAGRIALRQGDVGHARRCFAAALPLLRRREDGEGIVLAVSGLAWASLSVGEVDPAVRLARDGVELARPLDESWVAGDALNTLGTALRLRGDLDGSSLALEEAVALRRGASDLEGVAATLGSLAWLEVAAGDLDAAEDLFREAAELGSRRDDLWYATAVEVALAYLELARGDLGAARERAVLGLRNCRRLGNVRLTASALKTLAAVDALAGAAGGAAILVGVAASSCPEREPLGGTHSDYGWETAAVDAALTGAREQLGTLEWDRRVARGAALSKDDVDQLVAV